MLVLSNSVSEWVLFFFLTGESISGNYLLDHCSYGRWASPETGSSIWLLLLLLFYSLNLELGIIIVFVYFSILVTLLIRLVFFISILNSTDRIFYSFRCCCGDDNTHINCNFLIIISIPWISNWICLLLFHFGVLSLMYMFYFIFNLLIVYRWNSAISIIS